MNWRNPIWMVFCACLAVALGALVWMSVIALGLDRSESEMRREDVVQGDVRLALWRMDSALAPFIAREIARPYFSYASFHPAERAYTRMYNDIQPGEVLVPSPLLAEVPPYTLLHFQFDPEGNLTSPQVPTGNMQDIAEARGFVTHEAIQERAARLTRLKSRLRRDVLAKALGEKREAVSAKRDIASVPGPSRENEGQQQQELAQKFQRDKNRTELQRRQQYTQQIESPQNLVALSLKNDTEESDGNMSAVWRGDVLVLARTVSVEGRQYVQGCWLDWPALKKWLLEQVADLLPEADLKPIASETEQAELHMLAALPVALTTGFVPAKVASTISPIRIALVIAWICVVGAAVMVALLLRGAVRLSERRGAFVSAVTHELRTPLTTFRMYTEMLADNIVSDEEKRQSYLNTLQAEADRLGHLVENVLAYAQLDGGRFGDHFETVSLDEFLDRLKNRLGERTRQAGMELVVRSPSDDSLPALRVDTAAVEQILSNLVDNACKYASAAEDRTVELNVERRDNVVVLGIRDHGPGIALKHARRLFRPFSKSAEEAAHSAPGLGLGLALSRRLARRMGGDLLLDRNTGDGSCFVLTLPLE